MTAKKFFINDAKAFAPTKNDSPYKRVPAVGDVHASFDKQGQLLVGRNKGVARKIKRAALKEPNLPNEIFDFLNNLPLYHSTTLGRRKIFFCHAGIKIGTPFGKQPKSHLLDHPELENFYRNYSDETVVVGHKRPKKIFAKLPQMFAADSKNLDLTKPIKVPDKNILTLDTRAKEDGQLSCVDVLSGEFWQSDASTDSESVDSILFVCSGNSCRSPMAKYVMRYLLTQRGLSDKVLVDSAGCNTYGGGPISKGARNVLSEQRIPFGNHVSKPFGMEDYRKFKCIIALDENMLRRAKEISGGDPDKKIRLFTNFHGRRLNVADPWHTGNYRRAYEEIHLGCRSLLKEIFG